MADIPKDSVNISSYDAFFNQMNQNGVDLDGHFGYQCWDGAGVVWYRLGWTLFTGPLGYAFECWSVSKDTNTHPPTITQITNISDIKRGDIIVFKPFAPGFGEAGHIGFANEDYTGGTYLPIFAQNQGAGSGILGKPFSVENLDLVDGFLGAFRYDAWNQPTPPTPTESKKKRKFPWVIARTYWNY